MSTLTKPSGTPLVPAANADRVTSYLFVGGDLSIDDDWLVGRQVVELKDAGITHVLDVRLECNDAAIWSESGVDYRWDGVDDSGQRIPFAWFDGVVAYAGKAIAAGGCVLTHCHMGINRGPSAGYAVLLDQGWDPVEAIEAIRGARPVAYVAYAEQALSWHHGRHGVAETLRHNDRARLRRWRSENALDVVRIIADVRRGEAR